MRNGARKAQQSVRGRVCWFNDHKGFGYVEAESGEMIFVHYTAIQASTKFKSLKQSQEVVVEIDQESTTELRAKTVLTKGL